MSPMERKRRRTRWDVHQEEVVPSKKTLPAGAHGTVVVAGEECRRSASATAGGAMAGAALWGGVREPGGAASAAGAVGGHRFGARGAFWAGAAVGARAGGDGGVGSSTDGQVGADGVAADDAGGGSTRRGCRRPPPAPVGGASAGGVGGDIWGAGGVAISARHAAVAGARVSATHHCSAGGAGDSAAGGGLGGAGAFRAGTASHNLCARRAAAGERGRGGGHCASGTHVGGIATLSRQNADGAARGADGATAAHGAGARGLPGARPAAAGDAGDAGAAAAAGSGTIVGGGGFGRGAAADASVARVVDRSVRARWRNGAFGQGDGAAAGDRSDCAAGAAGGGGGDAGRAGPGGAATIQGEGGADCGAGDGRDDFGGGRCGHPIGGATAGGDGGGIGAGATAATDACGGAGGCGARGRSGIGTLAGAAGERGPQPAAPPVTARPPAGRSADAVAGAESARCRRRGRPAADGCGVVGAVGRGVSRGAQRRAGRAERGATAGARPGRAGAVCGDVGAAGADTAQSRRGGAGGVCAPGRDHCASGGCPRAQSRVAASVAGDARDARFAAATGAARHGGRVSSDCRGGHSGGGCSAPVAVVSASERSAGARRAESAGIPVRVPGGGWICAVGHGVGAGAGGVVGGGIGGAARGGLGYEDYVLHLWNLLWPHLVNAAEPGTHLEHAFDRAVQAVAGEILASSEVVAGVGGGRCVRVTWAASQMLDARGDASAGTSGECDEVLSHLHYMRRHFCRRCYGAGAPFGVRAGRVHQVDSSVVPTIRLYVSRHRDAFFRIYTHLVLGVTAHFGDQVVRRYRVGAALNGGVPAHTQHEVTVSQVFWVALLQHSGPHGTQVEWFVSKQVPHPSPPAGTAAPWVELWSKKIVVGGGGSDRAVAATAAPHRCAVPAVRVGVVAACVGEAGETAD
eukprot:ctg_759.g358